MTAEQVSLQEVLPPPRQTPVGWMRQNLFNNWYNSVLTIVAGLFAAWALYASVRWVVVEANWSPVTSAPMLFLVGQYPRALLGRIGISLGLMSLLFGLSWGVWGGVMRAFAVAVAAGLGAMVFLPSSSPDYSTAVRLFLALNPVLILVGWQVGGVLARRWPEVERWLLVAWGLSALLMLVLLRGVPGVLQGVPTNLWGGLLLTIVLAVGGILLSFPIGVLLALGRRSSLPVIRLFSTIFIETVRGVPLIGILFMSSIIFPLFLPTEMRIDRLIRALLGMTLFSAAYMAENVRGGLQAIPLGQIDAAHAVGLNTFKTTLLIVLPQALRAVIPSIVGQFIGLFKDTTLAAGVGLLELLSVGQSILQANPRFFSLQTEVYLFVAAVFWIFSYSLSYASRQVETALGVGKR